MKKTKKSPSEYILAEYRNGNFYYHASNKRIKLKEGLAECGTPVIIEVPKVFLLDSKSNSPLKK